MRGDGGGGSQVHAEFRTGPGLSGPVDLEGHEASQASAGPGGGRLSGASEASSIRGFVPRPEEDLTGGGVVDGKAQGTRGFRIEI